MEVHFLYPDSGRLIAVQDAGRRLLGQGVGVIARVGRPSARRLLRSCVPHPGDGRYGAAAPEVSRTRAALYSLAINALIASRPSHVTRPNTSANCP